VANSNKPDDASKAGQNRPLSPKQTTNSTVNGTNAGSTGSDKPINPMIAAAPMKAASTKIIDLSDTVNVPVLHNINLEIPRGKLVAIVGAVAAGKSSLLSGILGEMKRTNGEVEIGGSVAYCSQSAWIQNATVRENILFGHPFDERRYNHAIEVCALTSDLEILPAGDLTEIGEKGINLSGGQKQRVNLARSVYFNSDIVLLDDPLSAVDSHVSKYLFNECIMGALAGKTRILVTHQLHYMSQCDLIVTVKEGVIAEMGDYQTLMHQQGEFQHLMETYVVRDEETEEEEEEKDPKAKAKVKAKSQSSKVENGKNQDKVAATKETVETAKRLMQAEERAVGSVSWSIYLYYAAALGGLFITSLAIGMVAISQGSSVVSSLWLSWWTSYKFNLSTNWYIIVYAIFGIVQCILTLASSIIFTIIGTAAARRLHDKSFKGVLKATMTFFDTTPLGRIINRFSRDQDVIDSLLLDSIRMFFNMTFGLVATFVLICVLLPYFTIALGPIMLMYLYVQSFYRSTSREIKRLDSITKSPLFAHFSETLTGLPTIRAYRQQAAFIRRNEERMNGNNRPYYCQILSQRWLALRVESIGALIIFFAALIAVIQGSSISASSVGLIISYALSITASLNFVIRQSVEMENNMNSVERSKFYTDQIPVEAAAINPQDAAIKEQNWPQKGEIRFKDYSLRYRDGLPLVLSDISLTIKGRERVAIVGRTGAGKSSLSVALFRLVEAAGGSIEIDGVAIDKLGLETLRSSLSIIPQDPVLYSGTVRSNLDPFNQRSDEQLWASLEKAYLAEPIKRLEKKLEAPVSENGENFSVGQRCQMCLARALLRDSKILVLDEATASLDLSTDALIQTTIKKNFNCTIVTIAHRLNTVVDYDRILVLDYGRIKEFDTPANLLRNPAGIFTSMVNETGEQSATVLRDIAFAAEKGIKLNYDEYMASTELGGLQSAIQSSEKPSVYNLDSAVYVPYEADEPSKVQWNDMFPEEYSGNIASCEQMEDNTKN
jgi:ATP-binding cassette subfamily C (CFTR/MRP) protein 1